MGGSSASSFSRGALIIISCVAVLVVAIGSFLGTVAGSAACLQGGGFCSAGVESWMPWAMLLGPPLATIGFGVVSVRSGRFTPIAAGALLFFIVGIATPAIVVG